MANYEWQQLKDDKKFEELINELCIQEYKREFQLYGRNGQKQNGIDGKCSKGEICFQCKNKNDLTKLREDLESDTQLMMDKFTPVKSIFACAAQRDTKLQDLAEVLSKKHSIEIIVWSWNEIEGMIEKYEDVAKKFYPHIYKIKIIIQNLDTKASDGLIQNIAIETEKYYASHNETLDKLLENEGFVDYLKKQIDYHLKTNTPLTEQLEKLSKQREEDKQEFEKMLKEAKGTDYEALLLEAQVAFDNYNETSYREILDGYKADKAGQQYIKNLANSYYLKSKSYHRELNYPKALFEISEATRFDNNNSDYLHWYGYIAHNTGDYDTALKYYQKSLVIYEKVRGTNHSDTATSYNNIGGVYYAKGDYDKALEFYQKSLVIKEEVLGIKHPDTATSYNNIGGVYYAKGDYDKALEFFQKSLAIGEKVLGTKHPDTATSYNNIGGVYESKGDYDKALEFYQKSLDIREKVLVTKHPDTATSYNNIGGVYESKGDYDKALEFYQKSLAIREKVLVTKHSDTATSYNNIGLVYKSKGDYDKALEFYQKSLAIREKVLGTKHPDTAQCYTNIAILFMDQGKYAKALELVQKAYPIYLETLGKEHPQTKNSAMGIEILKSKL